VLRRIGRRRKRTGKGSAHESISQKEAKASQPQPRLYNLGREFPQVKGRPVERIELTTQSGYHAVTIRFQDNTDLEVRIIPR